MKKKTLITFLCATAISTCLLISKGCASERAPDIDIEGEVAAVIGLYRIENRSDPFSAKVAQLQEYLERGNRNNSEYESLLSWPAFITAVENENIRFDFSNPAAAENEAPSHLDTVFTPTQQDLVSHRYVSEDGDAYTGLDAFLHRIIHFVNDLPIIINGHQWNFSDGFMNTMDNLCINRNSLPQGLTITPSQENHRRYSTESGRQILQASYTISPPSTGWNFTPQTPNDTIRTNKNRTLELIFTYVGQADPTPRPAAQQTTSASWPYQAQRPYQQAAAQQQAAQQQAAAQQPNPALVERARQYWVEAVSIPQMKIRIRNNTNDAEVLEGARNAGFTG
ncbi:MAG: hypothetical protein Q8S21_00865 [Candidatus Paracaedibacteraceae bacterium]|nr:hypothetical protein [Candidatus Paracaedibacteraceae bacterium]